MDRLSRSMIAALVVLACTTAAGARTEKAVAVEVSAMEHVRELSSEMAAALRSVAGVTGVWEADRESWDVAGAATGPALVEAAARMVDEHALEVRAVMDAPEHP